VQLNEKICCFCKNDITFAKFFMKTERVRLFSQIVLQILDCLDDFRKNRDFSRKQNLAF
jgi:hypothetical protein